MTEPVGRTRFLTVLEVAEVMRVSKMTVYRLLHSGELPGVRVGRSFRVPQEALEAFLRSSATVVAALQDAESGASGDSAEHSVRRSS
jgi:excisionase family DNA binding protein